jgi:amino acid transporter
MIDFSYIFFLIIAIIAVFNFFTIFKITQLPEKDHRFKRYWTNIVLFLPIFGAILYYLNKNDIGREND